jgi:hypothetical protein
MKPPLTELVTPVIRVAVDGEARLALVSDAAAEERIVGLRGTLDGPHCVHARTLPTLFRLHARRDPAGASAEVMIADPCYWTPALPFLYILVVELEMPDGTLVTVSQTLGLRRWHADGANVRLERRRFVLRGATTSAKDAEQLAAARDGEAALVVRDPSDSFCQEASRIGVGLIADLRGVRRDLGSSLRRFAWQPAVMLGLVDDDAAMGLDTAPGLLLGRVVQAGDSAASGDRPWASVLAAELAEGERPPAWLATCGKPVMAIRPRVSHADFPAARAACDQMQAELAPEFNLAGYFVSAD